MELCLGTVQFGMKYGISGHVQPSAAQAVNMLEYAVHHGVRTIDTAAAYGSAELIVGEFFRKSSFPRTKIKLITKLNPNVLDEVPPEKYYETMKLYLEKSLARLQTDYVDGYLLHSARYVFNSDVLLALGRLKEDGLVHKTGVSVYEPEEAKAGIANEHVDLIQLPYSIFDQRMEREAVFVSAEKSHTEIHSRSAFLQGLILMDEHRIPSFLCHGEKFVKKFRECCADLSVSRKALAFSFVKRQKTISRLVFGVDSMEQLAEDIKVFHQAVSITDVERVALEFEQMATDIIMPSLWAKK